MRNYFRGRGLKAERKSNLLAAVRDVADYCIYKGIFRTFGSRTLGEIKFCGETYTHEVIERKNHLKPAFRLFRGHAVHQLIEDIVERAALFAALCRRGSAFSPRVIFVFPVAEGISPGLELFYYAAEAADIG